MSTAGSHPRAIFLTLLAFLLNAAMAGAQDQGGLWHTIRFAGGSWQPFGNVKGQAGDPGPVTDVAAAGDSASGDLQVVVSIASSNGRAGIWHTIRAASGAWQAFGDAGQPGQPVWVGHLASALIGCNLHVVLTITGNGAWDLWHAIRSCDGTWAGFFNVKDFTGDPGPILDVSLAGDPATGELHLVASSASGLWHAIRASNGTWTRFSDVLWQAGNLSSVGSVASSLVGCDLHVVVSSSSNGVSSLWHTIRFCNTSWWPFGDGMWQSFTSVNAQAGNPGDVRDVSIAGNGQTGQLHVVASTTDGRLWHTIRGADGSWLGFGDVGAQAGRPGICGVGAVHAALIGNSLHVVVATSFCPD